MMSASWTNPPPSATLDGIEEEESVMDADSVATSDNAQEFAQEASPSSLGDKLAKRETAAVTSLRVGLLVALVSATIIVSLSVFFYTKNQEEQAFENAFADNSLKLIEAFQAVAERRLSAISSFGATITSYALSVNATWPFVTIPQMEARGSHILSLSQALTIAYGPIVEKKDRSQWENEYVPQNIGWAEESYVYYEKFLELPTEDTAAAVETHKKDFGEAGGEDSSSEQQGSPPTYEGMPDFSQGYSKEIFTRGMTSLGSIGPIKSGDGPYIPWWQRAPSPRTKGIDFINIDLMDDPTFDGDLLQVLKKKRAALGRMNQGGYGESQAASPISGFYYPVLEDLSDTNTPVVATLGTLIYWDTFFNDILPQNSDGIVAVVENTCDQSFTFQINGPNVVNLGEGDLHDTNYDDTKQEVSFTTFINESVESGSYLGFPLDENGCQYTLRVYASAEMEDDYISHLPAVYMVGSILIFLFTSLVFFLYDYLVERRQRLVLKEAEKSGAIVSSLFPAAYRDRLMEEQENKMEEAKKASKGDQSVETKGNRLSSFMKGEDDCCASANDNAPIADLYQDCTVLFADIAGFTAWSSTRDPAQVFTLLQTVYGAFDTIARKRRVFKVETIGDCYLAVTGLPDPQSDHAVIMAKFANACILKMNETTRALMDKLGEGTEEMSIRIGLHSGPVTAGILRGEKSRFQLFGDTVNTASRMESTGQRNRIQASPATAELLKQAGKGHWLKAREDLIEAKGKGTIQTYWVVPDRTQSSLASSPHKMGKLSLTSSSLGSSSISDPEEAKEGVSEEDDFANRLMTRMSR